MRTEPPYKGCTQPSGACFVTGACIDHCRRRERDKTEAENAALRKANVALVQALDRIRDILSGDEYMEHADKGIHEIVNDAIRLHDMTANAGHKPPHAHEGEHDETN